MMSRFLPTIFGLALSACAAGPDYVRPAPPSATTSGAFVSPTSTLTQAAPLPDRWWRLYDDSNIDRLVQQAFAANTDLRQAIARLERARGVLDEVRGDRLPSAQLSAGARYRRGNLNGAGITELQGSGVNGGNAKDESTGARTVYSGGLDVAYEIDLFGRIRRNVEAARADVAAQAAATDYVRVTVAAETTRAYAGACAAGERLAVARQGLAMADRTLELARRQQRLGVLDGQTLERLGALREQAAAVLPPIENERRAALFSLALLTGKPPQEADAAAGACARPPRLLRAIPIGDGQALLTRRPDVREAERRLAAATARIGIATADLYPRIALGGSVVGAGTSIGQATSRQGVSFALGPLISWTFPNVTAARARIGQAEAQTREALAAFDGAWLGALNETERALTAYATEADRNTSLRRALNRQSRAYRIAGASARLGATAPLDLLDTERVLIQAQNDLAASDALLLDRSVSLFKALGGGWQMDARP